MKKKAVFPTAILRIIDANFNRCKEGLRVTEDILRFTFEDKNLRNKLKQIRHSLDIIFKKSIIKKAITTRNSLNDIGKDIDPLEIKQKDIFELLYANLQRSKEALRVLEECFKVFDITYVNLLKKLRFTLYHLEKKCIEKCQKK